MGCCKEVMPLLQSFHNGQDILSIPIGVLLCTWAVRRVELYQLPSPETVILVEFANAYEATCMSMENNWPIWINNLADGCMGGGPVQFWEDAFIVLSPFPFGLFWHLGSLCILRSLSHECCYLCTVPDDQLDYVCESKKHLQNRNGLQICSKHDCSCTIPLNANLIVTNVKLRKKISESWKWHLLALQ